MMLSRTQMAHACVCACSHLVSVPVRVVYIYMYISLDSTMGNICPSAYRFNCLAGGVGGVDAIFSDGGAIRCVLTLKVGIGRVERCALRQDRRLHIARFCWTSSELCVRTDACLLLEVFVGRAQSFVSGPTRAYCSKCFGPLF